ncbi:MAG: T9SS type A sorting domain-containing protein [Candidatus Kapabacteria bacterium]|nr:T9SS type A sorting domain-containing protein [Candidatus Kapabacteria bacterium]
MRLFVACLLVALTFSTTHAQTGNPLWIPDTLAGPEFNLTMAPGHMHFFGEAQTMTAGFNVETTGRAFWGPTLIFRKGDTVRMNVTNNLGEETTVHWHGMHLPAIMDGGPHQVIKDGQTWRPYWEVKNHAATYWYHPHLHHMAQQQLLMGLGGMIIVRDEQEAALNLPRRYGIDDIPLALSDRAFDASQQISDVPYGDSAQVNGVLRAEWNAPAQVVRFRILNASTERSYNLGFSDGRKLRIIASDGGLLERPVEVDRLLLSSGERVEILVDMTADKGKSFYLTAFNSTLAQNIPGGDVIPVEPFRNALARKDFNLLRIIVGDPTDNPVTTTPQSLVTVQPHQATLAMLTRKLTISDTMIPGIPGATFLLNHRLFNMDYIDYRVPLDNVEIWEISNSGNFAHPFHIHDVEFNVLTRNGAQPPAYEQGWKDVVLVKARETVRFIARFENFADADHPYMFHCHIALHEDEGMMGQFVVIPPPTDVAEVAISGVVVYPNPAYEHVTVRSADPIDHIIVYDQLGAVVVSKATNDATETVIETSGLASGSYVLRYVLKSGKQSSTTHQLRVTR